MVALTTFAVLLASASAFAPASHRLRAPKIRGGSELEAAKNSAFVFVKPHAVTAPTIDLVREKLEGAGLNILSEGDIASEDIDSKKLVDQHYYAIASKATITPPAELAVPDDKFTEFFGESWADVLKDGRAYTAIDACKELGLSGSEMDEACTSSVSMSILSSTQRCSASDCLAYSTKADSAKPSGPQRRAAPSGAQAYVVHAPCRLHGCLALPVSGAKQM